MRIAILSFAHPHAFGYIELLKNRPEVELLTCDPDPRPGEPSGAEEAAARGVAHVETLAELWAWQPDGVIVCTENSRHRSAVEQAAAAGAHVLCEKPLATTMADARTIIEICARAGVRLMTAYPVRFSTAFTALKAGVDEGLVGEVVAVAGANNGKLPTQRDWFADPELAGGGAVMDHTVHIADLLDELLPGVPAVSVHARANRLLHAERAGAETGGLVSIQYADGTIATIDCSWSMPAENPAWGGLRVQVLGTRGVADLDAFDGQRIDGFSGSRGTALRADYGVDPNEPMVEEFLEVVATGRAAHPDGEAGLRSLAVALAAYESLQTGQPAVPA